MNGPFRRAIARLGWNFIRWLLILTIGVLVPLSYVDNYSPHIGLRRFHISLFEAPNLRQPLPEAINANLRKIRAEGQSRFLGQTTTRYLPYGPGFSHCIQQHVGYGFLLPNLVTAQTSNLGVSLHAAPVFQGQSAWLPPPAKPPT